MYLHRHLTCGVRRNIAYALYPTEFLEGGRLNPVTRDTVAANVSAFRLAAASRHHKV